MKSSSLILKLQTPKSKMFQNVAKMREWNALTVTIKRLKNTSQFNLTTPTPREHVGVAFWTLKQKPPWKNSALNPPGGAVQLRLRSDLVSPRLRLPTHHSHIPWRRWWDRIVRLFQFALSISSLFHSFLCSFRSSSWVTFCCQGQGTPRYRFSLELNKPVCGEFRKFVGKFVWTLLLHANSCFT